MAIDQNQKYALKGSQIEDLAARIKESAGDISDLEAAVQALATDFSYKGSVEDYAHLPNDAAVGDVYTTADTGIVYVWDGSSWIALNATPEVFTGATGSVAGTSGLVPAPATTDVAKFLSGDGTWKNTTAFLPFPSSVNTSGTTQQFMTSVLALNPPVGAAYLGTVSLSDLPASLIQEEVEVYVYSASTIYCVLRSADTAPYMWWCSSYQYGGWRSFAPSVVQTIGDSTADVMSQNAVSSEIYADPTTGNRVKIGNGARSRNASTTAVGKNSDAHGIGSTAIGLAADAGGENSVALRGSASGDGAVGIGIGSNATTKGQVDFSTSGADSPTSYGYNSSSYRLLTGLYDPQSAHDAANKEYVDGLVAQNPGTPTTSTAGTVGQILQDTINGKLYICTDTTGGVYTWTEVGTGAGVSITMTSTDPGEGAPLGANEFIAVYNAS